MAIVIYGLCDPRTQELRYVGQTSRKPHVRLAQHLQSARKGTLIYISAWIKGLLDASLLPEMFVLETHDSGLEADSAEQFWIEYFRSVGCRLVNRAIGGRAIRGWRHSPEQREKWRRERSGENHPRFGVKWSEAQTSRASEYGKQLWAERGGGPFQGQRHSDETRKLIREGRAANPPKYSPEARARQLAGLERSRHDPIAKESRRLKISGPNNCNFGKPGPRLGCKNTPEAIARMCATKAEKKRKAKRNDGGEFPDLFYDYRAI